MFSGIVSGTGRVIEAGDGRLVVRHAATAERAQVGGSVAVNGVCLTVVSVAGGDLAADVVDETLRRSNLGDLEVGDLVNLELPLTAGQFLDGHLLLGHVDATAEVRDVRSASGKGKEVAIALPADLSRYVAGKGSIGVDGMSLTVTVVDDEAGTFGVALIPHTLQVTVAGGYAPGARVNLEVDVVARYLERLVRERTDPGI
jgi:riboflavin synthase